MKDVCPAVGYSLGAGPISVVPDIFGPFLLVIACSCTMMYRKDFAPGERRRGTKKKGEKPEESPGAPPNIYWYIFPPGIV